MNWVFFSAQSFRLNLPSDLTCEDCTIRLVRQALEWGGKYKFWSCADVDIVKRFTETCSGHGRALAGRCRCDKRFYGEHCQYEDECDKDKDCGIRGRCVDVDATSFPRKQCFCEAGYFGDGCKLGKVHLLFQIDKWNNKHFLQSLLSSLPPSKRDSIPVGRSHQTTNFCGESSRYKQ